MALQEVGGRGRGRRAKLVAARAAEDLKPLWFLAEVAAGEVAGRGNDRSLLVVPVLRGLLGGKNLFEIL
jgi:hypothetical protein